MSHELSSESSASVMVHLQFEGSARTIFDVLREVRCCQSYWNPVRVRPEGAVVSVTDFEPTRGGDCVS